MEWMPYQLLDFSDEKIHWYNIDTRDFHGIASSSTLDGLVMPPNYTHNKEKYFHTSGEVTDLLNRYYRESGGKGNWRMLSLTGVNDISGWDLKYIVIVRHKHGLLVCKRLRDVTFPIKKSTLAAPVNQTHLNFIKD